MFFNYIKNYFVFKILKNSLVNVSVSKDLKIIQTVGLLIDESHFSEKDDLVKELIANGFLETNIKILVYRDRRKSSEFSSSPTFSIKNISWKAEITDTTITEFINEKFDLLISYYDLEKAFLVKVTNDSKAQFKVGFSTVDKRLNHLMIKTNVENHTVFADELFRYLKILNKI